MEITMTEWILGVAMLVIGILLVVLVLMQTGKDKQLSGSIAGGAETYFGKNKGNRRDKTLSRLTVIFSLVFGAIVVSMYVLVSGFYA